MSRNVTRGWTWTPPTNYYEYNDLYAGIDEFNGIEGKAIDVFLTSGKEAKYHGRLRYFSSTKVWKFIARDADNKVIEEIPSADPYYVYGFMPYDAVDDAELALLNNDPETTYADGAVLTIHGMQTITSDACVIIGAREGFRVKTDDENGTDFDGKYTDTNKNDIYDDGTDTRTNRLRRGYFGFKYDGTRTVNADGKSIYGENYLFLLFDHLYSALSIAMKVNGNYDKLRHIKLKKIFLQTSNADGPTKKKANVSITLAATAIDPSNANQDGYDPIQQVVFTPDPSSGDSGGVMYESETGKLLTTSFQTCMGHFMPKEVTKLSITCTYDVYDTNYTGDHPDGNLIRQNCQATNVIDLMDAMEGFTEAMRGYKYTINLAVHPTYLYVLSEPDLDNPTVVVEPAPSSSRTGWEIKEK